MFLCSTPASLPGSGGRRPNRKLPHAARPWLPAPPLSTHSGLRIPLPKKDRLSECKIYRGDRAHQPDRRGQYRSARSVFVQHLANTPAKTDKPPIGCASRSRFCRLWHECQAVGMVRVVNLDSDPGSTKQTTLTRSTSEGQGGLPHRVPQQPNVSPSKSELRGGIECPVNTSH